MVWNRTTNLAVKNSINSDIVFFFSQVYMIFLRSHNQTKIYENSWCPPEARSAVLAPLSVAREGIRDSDFTKIKVGINF